MYLRKAWWKPLEVRNEKKKDALARRKSIISDPPGGCRIDDV